MAGATAASRVVDASTKRRTFGLRSDRQRRVSSSGRAQRCPPDWKPVVEGMLRMPGKSIQARVEIILPIAVSGLRRARSGQEFVQPTQNIPLMGGESISNVRAIHVGPALAGW